MAFPTRSALFAALFASSPVSAETAQQFDLICQGESQRSPGAKPEAVTRHYRIDLQAKRWCWESCERANEIESVTADRITFYQSPEGEPMKHAYISRTDGSYSRVSLGRTFTHDKGTCEVAPFSGLPKPKF